MALFLTNHKEEPKVCVQEALGTAQVKGYLKKVAILGRNPEESKKAMLYADISSRMERSPHTAWPFLIVIRMDTQ